MTPNEERLRKNRLIVEYYFDNVIQSACLDYYLPKDLGPPHTHGRRQIL